MRGMSEFGPNTNRKSGVDHTNSYLKQSIKGSLLLHSAGEALVNDADKSGDFTVTRNKSEKKKPN